MNKEPGYGGDASRAKRYISDFKPAAPTAGLCTNQPCVGRPIAWRSTLSPFGAMNFFMHTSTDR